MSDSQWRRLWDLFERAVELPEAERDDFLSRQCGSDAALLARLQALLNADRQTRSALDQPLVSADLWDELRGPDSEGHFGGPVVELRPGAVLGSYRIGKRIGRGGMGSVFSADHVDESLSRRAVVKVVRSDVDSHEIRRRLMAERSILAGLDHGNIARLYDSGTAEGGAPYFVQEFVAGEPLDDFCEDRQLGLPERLALFAKVCDAVEYAHRNLVVHRDLKPKNILVTEDGEPKLLDFGIAKLLDPPLLSGGNETDATATWHRFLTPSYASPEQIQGRRTTTVSDVYSLGVILYELLTGKLPRRFEGRSLQEAGRLFVEEEPPLPSSVSGKSELEGDLDAIVLRALRTEPAQRYESVREMTRDLERYQQGRPVNARDGTWRYVAGKFARRHRRALAAVATLMLVLISFSVGLGILAHRVALERDVAELEREHKTQVLELVQEVFRLGSPYKTRGQALTVREALERSIPILDDRLQDQPDVQAHFHLVVGSILADLGLPRSAAEPLEQAIQFYRRPENRQFKDQDSLIRSLTKMASVKKRTGELEAAERHIREAIDLSRSVMAEQPGDRSTFLLAASLNEWVSVLCYQHQYSAALEPVQEALALTEGLPGSSKRRISLLELLARIRSSEGDYEAAARFNREALALRRETHGPEHPSRVPALNNLGSSLRRIGDLDAAAEAFQEAIDVEQKSFGEDSGPHLPVLLSNLGGISFKRKDFAAATKLYEQAHQIVLRDSGPEHWLVFAFSLRALRARIHGGETEAAQPQLERLLADWQPRLGDHWRWAEGRGILGESLSLQGHCAEAEPLLTSSFEKIVEHAGHSAKEQALERLKNHFERCGRPEAIEPFATQLTEVRTPKS